MGNMFNYEQYNFYIGVAGVSLFLFFLYAVRLISLLFVGISQLAVGFIISKPIDLFSDEENYIREDVSSLDSSIDNIINGISRFIVFIVLLIILLLLFSFIVNFYEKPSGSFNDVSSIFNGIATPILTFFTFSGMLVAIIMQHIQMKTTLIELKLARVEMIKSNKSLETQAENAELQKNNYLNEKFENNFYALFGFFSKLVDAWVNDEDVEGFFKEMATLNNFESLIDHAQDHRITISKISSVNAQLLAYTRSKIEDEIISFEEGQRYTALITSYINNRALIVMFIDAIINNKTDYFENLKYFQFIRSLNFKFDCVVLGKIDKLVEIIDDRQLKEFLQNNSIKAIKWLPEFKKYYKFVIQFSLKNNGGLFHSSHVKTIDDFIASISIKLISEKYKKDEINSICSFNGNYIFQRFEINMNELLHSILSEFINDKYEYYKNEFDSFIG